MKEEKMLGLTILVWIFLLGIIIGGLIVFFKNKKEKEDFDDFSLESERKKEKDLFGRENKEINYNGKDFKYGENINLTEEKPKYEAEKDKTGKFEKIITDNPIIKWRKSPWWIAIAIIIAIIRFCDGPDNKLQPSEAFQNQVKNQNIEDLYKEWLDTAEKYEENGEYEKAEEYYLKAAQYNKEI